MGGFDAFYEARDIITEILEKDLIGPVREDEVITELPTSYYVAGKLYPQEALADADVDGDESGLDGVLDSYDASISMFSQQRPSCAGITFALSDDDEPVSIEVGFARYELSKDAAAGDKELPFWVRRPSAYELEWSPSYGQGSFPLGEDAELRVLARRDNTLGCSVATIVLVNLAHQGSSNVSTAALTIFQPHLKISLTGEGQFVPVDRKVNAASDKEVLELELLYRDSECFARGHGCSVGWDMDHNAPRWVEIAFMPSHRVLQMKPRSLDDLGVFGMAHLARGERSEVVKGLDRFIDRYVEWVDAIEKDAPGLGGQYERSALDNVAKCRETVVRLRRSVSMLESDDTAYRAFRLANEAMLLQRVNSVHCEEGEVRWRPFQLAFFLQEVPSFVDPRLAERSVADLLWFPTGGGKTEAYLGIAAFCMFLRRLRDPHDGGVTVIMRYTLRLLTLQQFERASKLIVACEYLRRKNGIGGEPISIGLWVGSSLTPNYLQDAAPLVATLSDGGQIDASSPNPIQVVRCPFCGEEVRPQDYSVDELSGKMVIRCPNSKCEFHHGDGLPIHVVDEAIYKQRPTFIVSTVDKFAQIPKKSECASMFGIGCDCNPPELIIQDELHLISGPLGTIVGLYEAAIEKLCERDGVPPKVVASTATVRNADNQLRSLYGSRFCQFPPQGISMDDSFFAVKANSVECPDREYIGVMGVDIPQGTMIVRVNAALLFAVRYLECLGYSDGVLDAYWTLVGYFCTLRELGSALTLVVDSIQTRFAHLAESKFAEIYPGVDPNREYKHVLELTSRKSNSEVTEAITKLEVPYTPDGSFDVFDFVLATNMISVGVDVARLGCMIVDGQPKSNAEYIQATSRVGRRNPGLVVSVYNAARSRDRSYYEQFVQYHSALYKHVEAASLTPFSDRARDRALHAVVIALVRYLVPGMLENEAARHFRPDMQGLEEVKDCILQRVRMVDPAECEAVAAEIDAIFEEWGMLAGEDLCYETRVKNGKSLIRKDTDCDRFSTMNSMRNVEPASNIYIEK